MATTANAIHMWVTAHGGALRADDPRFQRSVLVIHREGSVFAVANAFLVQVEDWIVMFSEHQGSRMWHREDLVRYVQFADRLPVDEVSL